MRNPSRRTIARDDRDRAAKIIQDAFGIEAVGVAK
jgi:hypothetical protein